MTPSTMQLKGMVARARDWQSLLRELQWRAARAMTPRRWVRTRGLRFTLQCENWITHYRWRGYNEKEPETLNWIDRSVLPGDVLFDIGANIGVYTLYAALRHPGVRVIAFEPEYANLHLLRDNIIANALQGRVDVYGLALSNRAGISQLHLQDLAPGSALHSESRTRLERTLQGRPVVWREGIAALTLDGFCEEAGLWPQVLKIDVDGTEPLILEGARETLRAPQLRSVIIEMPAAGSAREQCERLLQAGGLRRAWADPSGASSNEVWQRDA